METKILGVELMNWITIGINVGATGIMLAIIGYFLKRWMEKVDQKLDSIESRWQDVELKIASLPAEYVTRSEYLAKSEADSLKREKLWKSIRNIDTRCTIIETTMKIKAQGKSNEE